MKKRITRGGKRRNSGRKSVDDPKVQTSCYLLTSRIKALGGMESMRKFIVNTVEHEYNKISLAREIMINERSMRSYDRIK